MRVISNLIEAHIFREKDSEIEFLLLKRAPYQYYPNLWQMVSGKIKDDEKAYETALREIKEETGLIPEKIWIAPNINSFYSPDDEYISLIPVFAAKVAFDSDVKISSEHIEYKWLRPNDAKNLLAWEGQRKSVDIITEYFFHRKSFLNFVEIKIS
ncbi:dATP pyrophosphohydrolase [Ignavibacterium album JCM 16511]|uniref:dATP pyrophosphohydrolase n=1 Tax=Ignavibacterium album (strain DSM 19864 / JCM 16511 / NBRC 101810 / Mat9-16) TaxID=945713 RepID=I0AKG3_IGNAJ|nr:NUDIX pyrophosphatase [Ignavibacterium album]AFH49470.1 dATP pyrophosphohydrolase [Ignavibacterium album JCM 16511]